MPLLARDKVFLQIGFFSSICLRVVLHCLPVFWSAFRYSIPSRERHSSDQCFRGRYLKDHRINPDLGSRIKRFLEHAVQQKAVVRRLSTETRLELWVVVSAVGFFRVIRVGVRRWGGLACPGVISVLWACSWLVYYGRIRELNTPKGIFKTALSTQRTI